MESGKIVLMTMMCKPWGILSSSMAYWALESMVPISLSSCLLSCWISVIYLLWVHTISDRTISRHRLAKAEKLRISNSRPKRQCMPLCSLTPSHTCLWGIHIWIILRCAQTSGPVTVTCWHVLSIQRNQHIFICSSYLFAKFYVDGFFLFFFFLQEIMVNWAMETTAL